MRVRMSMNGPAIERLRTRVQSLLVTQADASGPLLRELDQENIRQVRRAFATRGGTVATGPWPPWSAKYARWRQSHARLGTQMMILTGTLRDKFQSPSHGDHVARWTGPRLRWEFGAKDDVAFMHEHGRGHQPVRSVIDKTAADRDGFISTFKSYYKKRIEQATRHA
jgi:hypothetical protein